MPSPQITPGPTIIPLVERDGISTCGYFNGDQNEPYVCPASYYCTLDPAGPQWGCVNTLHSTLAVECLNADEPTIRFALNCNGATPYCNTLELVSGTGHFITWTCGPSSGYSTLLYTYTGTAALVTTSEGTSTTQVPLSTSPPLPSSVSSSQVSLAATAAPSFTSSIALSPTSTTLQPSATASSAGGPSAPNAVIIAGAITGICTIIAALIAAGCCVWKKSKEKKKDQTENEDSVPLSGVSYHYGNSYINNSGQFHGGSTQR